MWINIQDEMPPDNEIVLVYIPGIESTRVYEYSLKLCRKNAVLGSGHEWDERATHWMRLPNPPLD